jgi:hypothetical protein
MSQWLNAEALAQYIMGFLAAALIILGWWLFRRERARYILVETVSELSLIWIDSAFRDRMTVTLDKAIGGGGRIEALSQLVFKISNITNQTIENVVLRFFFEPGGARLLYVELTPPEDIQWQGDSPLHQQEAESQIRVSLPYLKSSKVYGEKQVAILTLLADGYPQLTKVIGGGRDWIARYLSEQELIDQSNRRLRWITITSAIAGLGIFGIVIWALYQIFSLVIPLSSMWTLASGVCTAFILAGVIGWISSRLLWWWGRGTAIRRRRPRR